MYNILYVGIDDTDSSEGMCTTYIGAVIMDELRKHGFHQTGFPRLIRLNPFAQFKTRGNGAISFKLILKSEEQYEKAKNLILNRVKELSQLQDHNTNPGVVFYQGDITPELEAFATETIRNIVSIEDAEELSYKIGAEIYKFKNGRGIIGALAAIGCPLEDKTYELLAYRIPENYGKKRRINYESVRKMDQETYPQTFDNLDKEESYIAIEPHTPCPILYGIRGENPEILKKAHILVKVDETIERIAVFESNQHTDQHLRDVDRISEMEKFKCYRVQGVVVDHPLIIEGGHVIITLQDASGRIECAAYEPTKRFREVIKELKEGDELMVYGGIGKKGTLNLEKIQILGLEKTYNPQNPLCKCGKRMKSAGKGKGYKCLNCGSKVREEEKILVPVKRNIRKGFYEVPPSARRHLSKPLSRRI
ncbi:MAG: tRNA(Ile)(2)-agmatinylcytidine synthase [Methanobacteriaceae archaeon]|nr:tRNA(Ile)(2)-agmatinylcytidine synthase [Methanobacteriaceae archaeon]